MSILYGNPFYVKSSLRVILNFFFLRNDEPDFLFARAWIPLYFFCGVVTFGSIGRQLAMVSKTSI